MRKVFGTAALSLMMMQGIAQANETKTTPKEIPSPVTKIFVPEGFDDNDNAEIILKGEFPNSCYHVGRTGVNVDQAKMLITVWGTAYEYAGSNDCLEVVTPFIQEVSAGILKKGAYKVVFQYDKNITADLNVSARTTESPEDYLYAPVVNARLNIDTNGKQSLTLEGNYPYMFIGCMRMREVRTNLSNSDVLVVQPITEIVNDDECFTQPSDKAFSITTGLAEPFTKEGLIHVRVLNGDAINRLVQKP